MSKYLPNATFAVLPLLTVLLLLSVACGTSAPPTLAPTATPPPAPTPTVAPTATPLPTPTPTLEPTVIPTPMPPPTIEADHGASTEVSEHTSGEVAALFPEIGEKMKDIRPVYTTYYHSEDWQAPGKNTTVNEVFELLKMDNIVTHDGYQQISPALVVEHEPDLIIADSVFSVVENPDLAGLHMVTDTAHIPHHIFVLRFGYSFDVNAPGFRDTVEAFAAFAYPDTFNIKEESEDDHGEGDDEAGHDHGDGHSHGH